MSFKVTFIGAGALGFTRTLLTDLLIVPEFKDIEIAFTDISQQNLDMVAQLCQRDIDSNGLNIKIHATTDRREALKGAKYVINCVRIGGLEAFITDVEIPLKYGVDQCVGDTLCAGGIMYAQRGIAAMLEFCKDIREVAAPDCIMLNYANPNAMITWACNVYGGVNTIGLCHGVQHGHSQISQALDIEMKYLDIICAGLNHQTWYISVKHNGVELKDKLLEAFEKHPEYSVQEKVRIDVLRRFGYYSTESNGHLSEYLAWYRKYPEEIEQWISMDNWINGETGGYLRTCIEGRNWFEYDFPNWMKEPPKEYIDNKKGSRGWEHGSYIIESLETGRVYRGHFNVVNNGCITNLPDDAIVEVPCYVDGNGINVPIVGDLPLGAAAICNQSVSIQRMSVIAAVTADYDLLRQAMLLDPLTGAVLTPPEVWQLADEMLVAQEEWLPQFAEAIAEAKKRLSDGPLLPYRGGAGLNRKTTATVEDMEKDREATNKIVGNTDKAAAIH